MKDDGDRSTVLALAWIKGLRDYGRSIRNDFKFQTVLCKEPSPPVFGKFESLMERFITSTGAGSFIVDDGVDRASIVRYAPLPPPPPPHQMLPSHGRKTTRKKKE